MALQQGVEEKYGIIFKMLDYFYSCGVANTNLMLDLPLSLLNCF